jgi:hypothetical protein
LKILMTPGEPGHDECLITSRDRSQLLLFITVADDKEVKNRVHLDLRPAERTREQEVDRFLALGHPISPVTGGPMAAAGSRSPIRRATSSASCPRTRPAARGARAGRADREPAGR